MEKKKTEVKEVLHISKEQLRVIDLCPKDRMKVIELFLSVRRIKDVGIHNHHKEIMKANILLDVNYCEVKDDI